MPPAHSILGPKLQCSGIWDSEAEGAAVGVGEKNVSRKNNLAQELGVWSRNSYLKIELHQTFRL